MIEWLTALLIFQHSPIDVFNNNAGINLLQEEDAQARAIAYYTKLLQEKPDDNFYLWNLSASYMANKQWDAAEKTLHYFVELLKTQEQNDLTIKNWLFYSYYNLANIYQIKKDLIKALDYYEKALSIYPNSKEVTINIELLLQNQEGGGQGEGEQDDKQEKNQQQEQQEGDEQDKKKPEAKPTPKPYQGQDLSKEDVRRILEELKRQEEEIRGKIQERDPKQKPDGKDW